MSNFSHLMSRHGANTLSDRSEGYDNKNVVVPYDNGFDIWNRFVDGMEPLAELRFDNGVETYCHISFFNPFYSDSVERIEYVRGLCSFVESVKKEFLQGVI